MKKVNFQEYEFVFERTELLYVNDKFIKNLYLHFGKFNRTFSAVNGSFDVVHDSTNHTWLVPVEHLLITLLNDRFRRLYKCFSFSITNIETVGFK